MAEKINVNVSPTPIQRNTFDVAMDLTQLELSLFPINDPSEIEKIFAKYYALAATLSYKATEKLESLVNEDVLSKIKSSGPRYYY